MEIFLIPRWIYEGVPARPPTSLAVPRTSPLSCLGRWPMLAALARWTKGAKFGTIKVVPSKEEGESMIPTPRMIRLALTLLLGASFAACSGDDSSGPESGNPITLVPPANSVFVSDNYFTPSSRTVSSGTTVTWTWVSVTDPYTGQAPNSHSVTFDDGVGNSSSRSNGNHTRQFTAAGTFPYYCSIHGRSVMSGEIVVQ